MASLQTPSAVGSLKGLPFPEGLYEQLAATGEALLADMGAWKVMVEKDSYTQYQRPCGSLDLPAADGAQAHARSIKQRHDYVAGTGTFPFAIEDCVQVIVRDMPKHVAKWDKTLIGALCV